VNVLDIIEVMTNIGYPVSQYPQADINGDGKINVLDIILVLINVGRSI